MTAAGDSRGRRSDLPRRLGEIITPALDRLAGGDEARAYAAWARAVGGPVARGTRPKGFRRGQLTVECASSVWANELTYLGPQILRRMDEVAPGHPVLRFRFVIGRLPEPDPPGDDPVAGRATAGEGRGTAPDGPGGAAAAGGPGAPGQGSGRAAAKQESRRQPAAPDAPEAAPAPAEGAAPDAPQVARPPAEGVQDGRLRAAIEASLRRSSEEPPAPPGRGIPSG